MVLDRLLSSFFGVSCVLVESAPPLGWVMASGLRVVDGAGPATPADPINANRTYSKNGIVSGESFRDLFFPHGSAK